jgi:ankyrin repeat protein
LRAAAEGQLHRIQHLIRLGADVDFSDEEEFTALHHAVLSGFEDCVQEFIRRGSDVNATTSQGVPLNLAAQKERGHVISKLLDARADKAKAISFAADHGHIVSDLTSLFGNAATSVKVEAATCWTGQVGSKRETINCQILSLPTNTEQKE